MAGEDYRELTDRNIGIITEEQQEVLKRSTVAIFGVGGTGGVVAELLCRSGIGCLKVVDPENFEPSNLNRQIFCFRSTVGKKKVEAAELFLKDINPGIKIEKYEVVNRENISEIFKGVNVAVLSVDKTTGIIPVCRKARENNIPLVESWAIHYANVRVYTKDTISLEDLYDLPSRGKQPEDLSEEDLKQIDLSMVLSMAKIEGLTSLYSEDAMRRVREGRNPTMAPFVWQNAVMMSIEVIKILLNWGNIALAPRWQLYDPVAHRVPGQ